MRSRNGYIMQVAPAHPHADCMGYVMQHRFVAEQAIGKHLKPSNAVHHIDGSRDNNINSNLVICEDKSYHELIHQREKSLKATGSPNNIRCWICGGWDDPAKMYVRKDRQSDAFHRECRRSKSK